jgi:phage-related protein
MDFIYKEMVWLDGTPKTPPVPSEIRIEAGCLFKMVQVGIKLSPPKSKPMPNIGKNCHELRINGKDTTWRFFYCIDTDFIVSIGSFCKKTQKTPKQEIELCKKRLKEYKKAKGGQNERAEKKKA